VVEKTGREKVDPVRQNSELNQYTAVENKGRGGGTCSRTILCTSSVRFELHGMSEEIILTKEIHNKSQIET